MTGTEGLRCDGCGQPASPEHIASRLKRLEWTTRWRPVHIGTLLLGALAPHADAEFLYAGKFEGQAESALRAAGVSAEGKTAEATLTEFQRSGYFLAHAVECAPEAGAASRASVNALIEGRLAAVAARIRRSLKPKRIILVSAFPPAVLQALVASDLGCPVYRVDGTGLGGGHTAAAQAAEGAGPLAG
jgi:hypothetical protein